MRFTLEEVLRAKAAARTAVAALSIAEKLRILKRLRERDDAIRRAVRVVDPSPARKPNR